MPKAETQAEAPASAVLPAIRNDDRTFATITGAVATPTLVSQYYEFIQASVLCGLDRPPEDAEMAMRIMEAIKSGFLTLWLIFGRDEIGDVFVIGTLTTFFATDVIQAERSVWIYSFHAYPHVESIAWHRPFHLLAEFAKANNCRKICAQSSVPRVMEIADGIGFNSDVRLLTLEV